MVSWTRLIVTLYVHCLYCCSYCYVIWLKQDTQCTYHVTLRRVRESLLQWKSNITCVCVCVCVCARARGPGTWACACACLCARAPRRVHVALFILHATRMRRIVTSFVAPRSPPYFLPLFHKRRDFRKNVIEHEVCVLIFSTTKTFLIVRSI
jgi:hypothetical protein